MIEPFLGEIQIFSGPVIPRDWMPCDGQVLPIREYEALHSIIGATYGGNGISTFALPDLRGRIPYGPGSTLQAGQNMGEAKHRLAGAELPRHTHLAVASDARGPNTAEPGDHYWVAQPAEAYAMPTGTGPTMATVAITATGGDQPHENRPPYLALNFCIAVQGIYPMRGRGKADK